MKILVTTIFFIVTLWAQFSYATEKKGGLENFAQQFSGMITGALLYHLTKCGKEKEVTKFLAEMATRKDKLKNSLAFQKGMKIGEKKAKEEQIDYSAKKCKEMLALLSSSKKMMPGTKPSEVVRRTWRDCRKINSDKERLVCFDEVAPSQEKLRKGESVYGAWTSRRSDDAWGVSVDLVQVGTGHLIGAQSTRPVELTIRCQNKNTELLIRYGDGFEQVVKVSISLDGGPLSQSRWNRSMSGGAAFWPNSTETLIPFLKGLVESKAETLTINTQLKNAPISKINYDLVGLEAALKPLAQACYWR